MRLASVRVDGYPLRPFDGARILRHRHGQDAILEGRLDGALIDVAVERYLSLEAAVEPFAVASIPRLALEFLLATHGEHAVLKQHFNIALLEARKFGDDPILFIGLIHIHAGPRTATSPESGVVCAPEQIVEQAIDLPMQTHYGARGVRS